MQIYKKKLTPYLFISGCLFVLFYGIGNFFWLLPGTDYFSKLSFLFTNRLEEYLLKNVGAFFLTPSILAVLSGVLGFLIGLLLYVYDNDQGVYRQGEEYGSARFATDEEMAKFSDKDPKNNMIISKKVQIGLFNFRLPIKIQKNKNVMVLGDSGSAKTLAYILTNILQVNASFVVTDPDGGIVHKVGKLLKRFGYKLKILDLNHLLNSDTFNVFEYIRTELDIDRVLEAITEGTKEGDHQGEEFWIKAEALLIRSFIAYLWFDGKDNEYTPNLSMVSDMLRHVERKDPKVPSPVECWFEEQNKIRPNNYAYKQWTLYNDTYKAETRASVLAIASARYSVFDHEQVADMIRQDTMEIDKWNEEKTAVFIAIPETNKSYNFIAAIFMATVMETLRHKSDRVRLGKLRLPKGKKLLHVRFLIDEFANIGRIPNFEEALATFRKREMSFSIILQSMAQLQKMYKNGWEGIVNNCSTILFLGGDEEKTTKYLSHRADKQTISLRKHSKSYSKNGGGSESRDKTGRDLLTPGEIGHLDGDECLVYISKEYVYKDKKYYAFDHPLGSMMGDEPGDENWYTYKRYLTEEEEILDKVRPENMIDHGIVGEDIA
ncbi:VirD4-like conjugal transfer protein, CD1115 family [Enterococcus faecalis]|uniref:VirD4-like conjugal transfer protein, CD1115 family n=1 Tax=Enterococcus faecalis TaxID=1351 RepID=UPI003D0B399E